jgi:hypothetical protein
MNGTIHGLRRRQFLAAMGLAGGSLFLPSRLGRAQTAAPPKRFVVVFTQHGFVHDAWRMRPPGTSEGADFDVAISSLAEDQFSRILRPLAGFKDRLLVVDGLSMASAEGDIAFNEHDKGTRGALTGAPIQDINGVIGASAPSIDQIIAQGVAQPGRLASLEFGVIALSNGGAIWRGAGQQLPPDRDPRGAFSRLFPPGIGQGELSNADRIRAGQSSVLDVVADQYDALLPRLSRDDRQKLELHRDLIRGVERRVDELAQIQCVRPDEPDLNDNFGNVGHYESRFDAFVDIAAAALACDLTRVISFQMSQLRNDHLGIVGDVHADYAHTSDVNGDAIEVMSRYGEIHAGHVNRLLTRLDSIPEGNGTLLDNTMVLWCSELATGTHKFNIWPAIIAGGGGGALRTGRYLRQVPRTPNPTPNPRFGGVEPIIGRPHNHLLLALAQGMGAPQDQVGGTELRTVAGERVDLTTTMDEILV